MLIFVPCFCTLSFEPLHKNYTVDNKKTLNVAAKSLILLEPELGLEPKTY